MSRSAPPDPAGLNRMCSASRIGCALTLLSTLALVLAAAPGLSSASAPARRRADESASLVAAPAASPDGTASAPYAPGRVVVGYRRTPSRFVEASVARTANATGGPTPVTSNVRVLELPPTASVPATVARLRHIPGVAWAAPDYLAHATGPSPTATATRASANAASATPAGSQRAATAASEPFPNDPGLAKVPGGWQQLQWNFVGPFGVQAPQAWRNLIADHAGGGRGVIVAVLDTGVAYANRRPFRISPDFYSYQFVKGYDFIGHDPYPNDRNGHGTDVAGTIAEATNNHRGLTGLAYGVRIMPVRVLDSEGDGDASVIAKGVRFAVAHGARVINLSLEFPSGITASDIPELISALRYANRRGVVVVGAAGNEAHAAAAYPARVPSVIAVGATTEHGCLASYSNYGTGVMLVAPGGGPDATLPGDPNCRPEAPPGQDIFQVTFSGSSPRKFGIPGGYEGTSMATPHVAAAAALVIASGVLGRHPTPARVLARLKATARPLGGPGDRKLYGAGLLDAAAATAPGGPYAVTKRG